jgi:hypothetical protein
MSVQMEVHIVSGPSTYVLCSDEGLVRALRQHDCRAALVRLHGISAGLWLCFQATYTFYKPRVLFRNFS